MKKTVRLFLGLMLTAACLCAGTVAAERSSANEDKIKIELFFESLNGQSWQMFFLADAVRRKIGGADIVIIPLVSKDEKGAWRSVRGDNEAQESKRIAVIQKFYPDRLYEYLNARSLNAWPDGWRDAAAFAGIAFEDFNAKIGKHGDEALEEYSGYIQKYPLREAGMAVNGKIYSGGFKLMNLFEMVNSELPQSKRFAIPKSPAVGGKVKPPGFWAVVDSASGISRDDAVISAFLKYFEGLKEEILEYDSAARKKMFKNIDSAPAYIIEDTEAVRSNFANMISAGVFKAMDKYFVYYDRNKKSAYLKNKEERDNLKIFVMSQCPFGIQAENAVIEAVRNKLIPEKTKVEIHFIADAEKTPDGGYSFKSLHGTAEWEENARQLLIAKKFPDKFFDYLLERNKDVSSSQWEAAALRTGINASEVSGAFEEAKNLLFEDVKLADNLNISTSPTFLVNGKISVVGLGELTKIKGFEKVPSKPAAAGACK
ncbi:MAG: hypothetical protein HY746_04370 [Elusimicrobia bacterium]|nr:hypothetical protein [Elusimicrobiota bacterium]